MSKNKNKGIKQQIFGIVILTLGAFNVLLNIVLESPTDPFYITLMVIGVLFVMVGFWRNKVNSN